MRIVREQMLCIVTPAAALDAGALRTLEPDVQRLLDATGVVHFGALALLPGRPGAPAPQAALMFELAVDEGLRPRDMVALLVRLGEPVLWTLYGAAAGPAPLADRARWLQAHLLQHASVADGAFVGARDRSVQRIRQEQALLRETQLAARRITPANAGDGAAALRGAVLQSPAFAWAREALPRSFWRATGRPVLMALGMVVFAPFVLPYTFCRPFRRFWQAIGRRLDQPAGWLVARHAEVPRAQQVHASIDASEAQLVGRVSHLISLTELRAPVRVHGAVLRAWLRLVSVFGRVLYTEGRLGAAPNIHFGHWHLIDGGRRLLFCSNYDGAFGGYLDDFINGAAHGLNLVWRPTELRPRAPAGDGEPGVAQARRYPPTRSLLWRGAKCEQAFKAYARDSMLPQAVRYEAYRASLADIERASALRAALAGAPGPANDDRIFRVLES